MRYVNSVLKLLAFLPSPIHQVYLYYEDEDDESSGGKYASTPIAPASEPARSPGPNVVNFVMSPKWR
jgi:hypothetical protein